METSMNVKTLSDLARELNLTLAYPYQSTGTYRFFYKVPFNIDRTMGTEFSEVDNLLCIGRICLETGTYQFLDEMDYRNDVCWCKFKDIHFFASFRTRVQLEQAIELVNNYPLKIKEEEIRKAKLRIECDFTPNGFPPPPEVEKVIE